MTVDAELGRVLAAIDQAELSKETLIIFSSDNGPVWYPEDVKKFGHDSAGGLRGMKGDAWEGGHRMPFIVRWPGEVSEGSVSRQTVCFTDLLATFADICEAELPADAGPDSFSILPVLKGEHPEEKPIRGPIVMQSGSNSTMMIRSGDWKLIDKPGSGGFSKSEPVEADDPPGQLYHLGDDPGETNNLYREHPEIVARLSKEMKEIVNSTRSR